MDGTYKYNLTYNNPDLVVLICFYFDWIRLDYEPYVIPVQILMTG